MVIAVSAWWWFLLSVLLLAVVGYFDSFAMVVRNAMILMITPNEVRGRPQSVVQMVTATGPSLAGVIAGTGASLVGAGPAFVLGGIASLGLMGLVHRRFPGIWRYRSPDAE